jgi:hypothetical protein
VEEKKFMLFQPQSENIKSVSAVVLYSSTYKASSLTQTRMSLYNIISCLPALLKEILSSQHGWPDRVFNEVKTMINGAADIAENVKNEFQETDNHTARAEYTFVITKPGEDMDIPLESDELSPANAMLKVATADLYHLADWLCNDCVAPLKQFLHKVDVAMKAGANLKGLNRKEVLKQAKIQFHKDYDQKAAPALLEASEVLLAFLNGKGLGEGSILKQFGKVSSKGETHIWQVPVLHRIELSARQKEETKLKYGLDHRVVPSSTCVIKSGKVVGVRRAALKRFKKNMNNPEIYLWAKARLEKQLAKLAGVDGLLFIDHASVLSSSKTTADLHDFFHALVHICLNAYDEEWSGYLLIKMKKRKRNEDGEDDFEHGSLPRIPKKASDVNKWNERTSGRVAMCIDFTQTGFNAKVKTVLTVSNLFDMMFGNISHDSNKSKKNGWCTSPTHILMKEVLFHLHEFEQACPENLLNAFSGNPFSISRFQQLIAREVEGRGNPTDSPIVWHTLPSNQRKYTGAAVPVSILSSGDVSHHQAVVALPLEQVIDTRKGNTDQFEDVFTISKIGSKCYRLLNILIWRSFLNGTLRYIYETKKFPKTPTEMNKVYAFINTEARKVLSLAVYSHQAWVDRRKNEQRRFQIFNWMKCKSGHADFITAPKKVQDGLVLGKVFLTCTDLIDFGKVVEAINSNGSLNQDMLPEKRPHFTLFENSNSTNSACVLDIQQLRNATDCTIWKKAMDHCWTTGTFSQQIIAEMDSLRLMWNTIRQQYFNTTDDLNKEFLVEQIFKRCKGHALCRWNNQKRAKKTAFGDDEK